MRHGERTGDDETQRHRATEKPNKNLCVSASLRLIVPAFLCVLASFGTGCLTLNSLGSQPIALSLHDQDGRLEPQRLERHAEVVGAPKRTEERTGVGRRLLKGLAATGSVLMAAPAYAVQQLDTQDLPIVRRRAPTGHRRAGLAFARTELFFGTAKRDRAVTPDEFKRFLDDVVTPFFPDGLTVTRVDGQFRGEGGIIIKEDSYVLVLLYPVEGLKASSANIDLIRREYMRRHQQESVLRVDDPYLVWASF
jgi:Protein of unknown function (DUF3574)